MSSVETTKLATAADFALCREISEKHGRTYALATRLLRKDQREAVWALYAWARIVDDYVDDEALMQRSPADREETVRNLSKAFHHAITTGEVPELDRSLAQFRQRDEQIIRAVAQTYRDFKIDPQLSDDFIDAMLMDVPGTSMHRDIFRTWAEVDDYMWGSAAVIGLQVLPILGAARKVKSADAAPFAIELGRAFQVTNFLRDIAEDFERGRIYLPKEEWNAFGVDKDELGFCVSSKSTTPRVRQALGYFIAYNRAMYRTSTNGVDMLDTPARYAIRAAEVLYSDILSEIEKANYNVFAQRVAVARPRRASVCVPLAIAALTTAGKSALVRR